MIEIWAMILTLGATACWGSAQVIGKIVMKDTGPVLFNFIRFSAVSLLIVPAARFSGSLDGIGFNLLTLLGALSGIIGFFAATWIYYYSLKREAAHRVIPAGNVYPFWAIVLAPLFLGEGLKLIIPVSACLIFLGSYLLIPRESEVEENGWRWAVPFASLAAVLWGANSILSKHVLMEGMLVSSLLAVRAIAAAISFASIVGIVSIRDGLTVQRKSVGLSILSGLIAFPLGSLMYLNALHMERASALAPITGSTVLFGFLLSVIILGEKPSRESVFGVMCIFGGILLMFL